MLNNKKIFMMASAAVIALPMAVATAATTNIDAVASFRQAISLTPVSDIDFTPGATSIEYAAAPGVGDTAALNASTGAITYAGNFSGPAAGTAGQVDISASDGFTVEVSCDATATMEEAGGGSIGVNAITVTNGGAPVACAGIATASLTYAFAAGTNDTLNFGGTIDGATAAGFVAGDYSTATGAGDDIEVVVNYQ